MSISLYLSTRCTQRAVRGDGHRVQEASVTNVVGLQLAVSQVPHLNEETTQVTYKQKCKATVQQYTGWALINSNPFIKGQVIHAKYFNHRANQSHRGSLTYKKQRWKFKKKKKRKKFTLTILSQPQETIMGLLLLGEKRTQDTHSVWLSSCEMKVKCRRFAIDSTFTITTHHKRWSL